MKFRKLDVYIYNPVFVIILCNKKVSIASLTEEKSYVLLAILFFKWKEIYFLIK